VFKQIEPRLEVGIALKIHMQFLNTFILN